MIKLIESIYPQFDSALYKTKLRIKNIQAAKTDTSIVIAEVIQGCISVFDYIKIGKNITEVINVFVNNQEVYTAVTGEVAELVIVDIGHRIAKSKSSSIITDSINRHIISAFSISYLEQHSLPLVNVDKVSYNLASKILTEGVIDDIKSKGLAVLKSGAKGLGVAAILSIFAYSLYNKLNKPCLTKIGLEKLKCQKQVADRVISELSRQQALCAQLSDPNKRHDCLKKVESKKKEWIIKSTQLGELIQQKEKV